MLGACASSGSQPTILVPEYPENQRATEDVSVNGCVWVVDHRAREDFHGYRMPSKQTMEWFVDGVEAELGVAAIVRDDIPADDTYIALDRAYMNHVTTSISGIVVIEVGDSASVDTIRGRSTRTNWWGSKEEYSRLMSRALKDALYEIGDTRKPSTGCAVSS
jgi:hypothetical protein